MPRSKKSVAHFTPDYVNTTQIYLSDTEADTISYVADMLDIDIKIQELS